MRELAHRTPVPDGSGRSSKASSVPDPTGQTESNDRTTESGDVEQVLRKLVKGLEPDLRRQSKKSGKRPAVQEFAIRQKKAGDIAIPVGQEGAKGAPDMAENKVAQATAIGTVDDPTRGIPYHEKLTAELKDQQAKKRLMDRRLAALEDAVYKKETDYLENTPYGNILTGFDNYIKGASATSAGTSRRRGGATDLDRLFSRSSAKAKDGVDSPGQSSALSTPAHAPTPINTSIMKGDASAAATPTSATSANRTGTGQKKGLKRGADDSETDTKETKKVRVAFNASRKQ